MHRLRLICLHFDKFIALTRCKCAMNLLDTYVLDQTVLINLVVTIVIFITQSSICCIVMQTANHNTFEVITD
jgi:hypothetical protein